MWPGLYQPWVLGITTLPFLSLEPLSKSKVERVFVLHGNNLVEEKKIKGDSEGKF